jgi:hypothetical protein
MELFNSVGEHLNYSDKANLYWLAKTDEDKSDLTKVSRYFLYLCICNEPPDHGAVAQGRAHRRAERQAELPHFGHVHQEFGAKKPDHHCKSIRGKFTSSSTCTFTDIHL